MSAKEEENVGVSKKLPASRPSASPVGNSQERQLNSQVAWRQVRDARLDRETNEQLKTANGQFRGISSPDDIKTQ